MTDIPVSELLLDHNPWWERGRVSRAAGYPARRDVQIDLRRRLARDDRRAILVLGPRQVGKTVALLQLADDLREAGLPAANLTYFDFSDDRLTAPVTAREVEQVRPAGLDSGAPRVLLLDEVGRASNWDLWLKQVVDQRRARVVATDSQVGLLRRGSRESGLGRWDEIVVEGLTFAEFARLQAHPDETPDQVLRRRPTLHERYLETGGFPEHARGDDYGDAAEMRRRLREDIAERAILHDLLVAGVEVERVKALFVYLVQDSGATFTAARRARDLTPPADARSVQTWVDLLEGTLLLTRLDRYGGSPSARLRAAPRIYAADHGLINAFAPAPARSQRVKGQAAEAAVFRHLREVARAKELEISYYREADDLESDFLVSGEELIAVEVTVNSDIRPDKLGALRRVRARLKPARTVLVFGGVAGRTVDGIECVPIADFLLDPIAALRGQS